MTNNTFKMLVLLIGIILIITVLVEFLISGDSTESISLGLKRTNLTINNTDNTRLLNNYSISMNVTYDTDMQTDFDDLRFFDNVIPLNYWLESKSDSNWAYIWVNVSDIPANSIKNISMNYGNSTAQSESNGTLAFLWYDDFEDGDISDWQTTNSPIMNVNSSVAYEGNKSLWCANGTVVAICWINITNYIGNTQQTILHYATYETEFSGSNLYWMNKIPSATTEAGIIDNSPFEFRWTADNPYEPVITTKSANTWYKIEMMVNLSNNNASARINNTYYANSNYNTSGFLNSFGIIQLRNRGASSKGHWDLMYARNYTYPEPTVSFGSEESLTTINVTDTHFKFPYLNQEQSDLLGLIILFILIASLILIIL